MSSNETEDEKKAKQAEKTYYDALWRVADSNQDGRLNGSEAVEFFRRTGLDIDQLEEIWNIIDVQVGHLCCYW